MTQKSKTAKFFCENCGAEVSRNAKVCRHCGRFFSSVRCPQCGKTGTPEEFSKGCPACGYTVESSAKNEKRLLKKEKKAPFSKRKALKNQINRVNNQTKSEKNPQNDENLPVWIFIFIFFIFLLIIYFFLKFF